MHTKRLLVLGTSSSAGKSSVVTALCRIFSDKWKVSPFKAQNMSLNSWVTPDGKEMSFAQVIQAWAARTTPIPEMNPVLLKPLGDRKSQVVVLGEHFANKTAGNYYDSIDEMNGVLKKSLQHLESISDAIIMEGAGGAAEINLYDRDIVNIGTARLTNAPILLVGDIERGGVFASLYGTMMLLPEDVRKNVKGFIINKFRGDPDILRPGLQQLEDLTGVPVLGIIPHIKLRTPSEDSMSFENKDCKYSENKVNIAVIKLPKISHFNDFEVLEEEANVLYIPIDEKLKNPDLIIIPGTGTPIEDLKALKESGMADQIKNMKGKCPIIGIGEGYHIMGKSLIDTSRKNTEYEGLCLLECTTVYSKEDGYSEKPFRISEKINGTGPIFEEINGEKIEGFVVHTGETKTQGGIFGKESTSDPTGLIIGTSVHQLFNNKNVRTSLLKYVCKQKGMKYEQKDIFTTEDAFDELAEVFRRNADMNRIEEIIKNSER